MDNKSLTHWGIKGMKWGRRRYQNKDGSLTPEGKKRYADDDYGPSEDYKKAHAPKKASEMSDAELRARLNRYQMEQQYARMTMTRSQKAKKAVASTLASVGSELAKDYAKKAAKASINLGLQKLADKTGNDILRSVLADMGFERKSREDGGLMGQVKDAVKNAASKAKETEDAKVGKKPDSSDSPKKSYDSPTADTQDWISRRVRNELRKSGDVRSYALGNMKSYESPAANIVTSNGRKSPWDEMKRKRKKNR